MHESWQYTIRKKNFNNDIQRHNLSIGEIEKLRIRDFQFEYVDKKETKKCQAIREFIEQYEWLGKMPNRPTHRFIATYNNILAGVIVMAVPNSFSDLLGEENKNIEKLISRGACISWSPKNLASALIMYSIRWMVQHTEYRFFTAYADTEANELGTIYQACNFTYLGKEFGSDYMYYDPENPKKDWFNGREFRKKKRLRTYAKQIGIEYTTPNNYAGNMLGWKNLTDDQREEIMKVSRAHEKRCEKKRIPKKHKYVYILGRTKAETKKLKKIFEEKNPKRIGLGYPKERGE